MRIFQCQKKTCFVCLLLLFCSLFLSFAFLSSPTHALSISQVGYGNPYTAGGSTKLYYSVDGGSETFTPYNVIDNQTFFSGTNYTGNFTTSYFVTSFTSSNKIPANSIFRFSLSFQFAGQGLDRPYKLSSDFFNINTNSTYDAQILDYSCSDSVAHFDSGSSVWNLLCNFTGFTDTDMTSFRLYFNLSAGNNGTNTVVVVGSNVSKFKWFNLNFDALNQNDRDWLSDDFLEAMTDAIAEGQKQANEDVKDQTETQTQQSESTSNTEGSSSETQGQTLLQAFSSFVSAITNVQPAQNCDLDVDFTGYAPGLQTTIDLCELSPPAGLTFIGSILLILFCVPLSISTVRKLISLFRSFQT